MRRLTFVLALLTAAGGSASAEPVRPRLRDAHVEAPREATKPVFAPMHRILFVNRHGGTYTPGADNSSTNTSSIVTQASTIPAATFTDAQWADVMTCITGIYERFSIDVVDVDPGDVAHVENVVGGYPSDIGQPADVGGIAPLPPCGSVVERAITYTFSQVWGNNVQDVCETIAQESAHAFGLDHEHYCPDPMTYLFGCGPKTFQDMPEPCGEYADRLCRCGGATQNSVEMLNNVLGQSDPIPPTATITSPGEGTTVQPGFTVSVDAQDNGRIARIELWIDGVYSDVFVTAAPYDLQAPVALAYGLHMVEVHVTDGGANTIVAGVNVDVEPECTSPADCGTNEDCADGRCAPGLGQPCEFHADCASQLCARNPQDERVCTQECSTTDATTCPDGFACNSTDHLCFVAPKDDGGGCATSSRGAGAPAALLLAGLALLIRRKKR